MARIVLGLGMSHSPMMTLDGSMWNSLIDSDARRTHLYNVRGENVTYQELEEQVQNRYADLASDEVLIEQKNQMERAFEQLHQDLKEVQPDVLFVIVNDHPNEWFEGYLMPALGIYYGETIVSAKYNPPPHYKDPETIQRMASGMGMDQNYRWSGSKDTAISLITSLMNSGFDVCAMRERNDNKFGHGHGIGMVVTKIMKDNLIPMVPIYLSTIPPTDISPSRCYDLGIAIKKAVEELPSDLRVGIIATGGLSHFVTDKDIDEQVIEALKNRDEHSLRSLPKHRLQSGSSEIRNWVTLGGAIRDLNLDWIEYIPVFRTPAGTGLGMAFGRWT